MATELVMPKWGLSMQEGLIVRWLKREGEPVEQGEPLLEVETEKITNVVEAPASGVLARVLYPDGATVPVTQVIALITAPGEPAPETAALTAPPVGPGAPASAATEQAVPAAAPAGIIPATPAARRLAKERGLDLAQIRGTGPRGTISKEDVEAALEEARTVAVRPLQKVPFFSGGHRLDGLLYSPQGLARGERRAAVVLCVGYTYLKTLVMPDIAKALVARGYVALLFDYRGFGDSEGPRWRLMPWEQVADIRAAVTAVADRAHVDPDRLALVGLSLGGSNAIVAAATDRRIGATVAIEPMGDGERWLRSLRRYSEWREFQERLAADRAARTRTGHSAQVDPLDIVLPDPDSRAFLEAAYREYPQMKCDLSLETAEALVEFRPEAEVHRIAPRPLLLIHGADDPLVPADESRSLYARAGEPRRLEILLGMSHFNWVMPDSAGFGRVRDLVVGFLQERLPAR